MSNRTILLGAHMSIAGGVHAAFHRATRIGCSAMQVFVKNNNQWEGKRLTKKDVALYKAAEAASQIAPVLAHAAYLLNLCAKDNAILKKSRSALRDELRRCEAFGIKALIVHPGSHVGAGEQAGIERVAESINVVHRATKGFRVLTALECTAGQGTALGYRFEHLRAMIDLIEERDRMAVCLDTCHLFAAGYDIGTEEGWEETMQEFDEIVGLQRLVAFHTNDSKRERGSRVDRHEHIGKGRIGLTGFRMVMNDPRLALIPKILETPKGDDMREDIENMNVLRSLISTVQQ
ncbi:MAG: deoxyribonuclease IV [Ignavibacteria bacterium]